MKNEKVYVYIGRFQMAHAGHEATIKHALENSDRLVILVGSSDMARDSKNPFTFDERKQVLDAMSSRLAQAEWAKGRSVKVNILPIHDYVYNNSKWLMEVHEQVKSVTQSENIFITGCQKEADASTFYLNFFPQWQQDFIPEQTVIKTVSDDYDHKDYVEHRDKSVKVTINSTAMRQQFFSTKQVPEELPEETKEFLEKFMKTKPMVFDNLIGEFNFVQRYRSEMKEKLPYDNIPFLTGDALVICAGHVLLVKRRTFPGKGLYALPGGFFDAWQDKDQVQTALRELKEETKIDVPLKVLEGSIRESMEFGDFNRSLRWRIITRCAHIQLQDNTLPKVKGSDDAEKAFWMPLGELVKNRDKFFEDHLSIIDTFLGIL